MKLKHLTTATAAVALLGGAAFAQQPQPPKAPTPGSVTGDWNGAHAPTDEKQYTEEVRVPIGAPPAEAKVTPPTATAGTSIDTDVTAQAETAPAAATAGQNVSVTTTLVTNGPIPDTPENRDKYGGPNSRAGKQTTPKGN